MNLALNSQGLNSDLLNLKKYQHNIDSNGFVIISLAPCTLLYKVSEELKIPILPVIGNSNASVKQRLKHYYPLIHPIQILKFISDEGAYKDIYDGNTATVSVETVEKKMKGLTDIWKNLFSLKDFKSDDISSQNLEIIAINAMYIARILDICKENKIQAIIIIPPFSAELNKFFSDKFVARVLKNKLEKLLQNYTSAICLDYRKNEIFQTATGLYLDGGFLLNRHGSQLLIKKVAEDLKKKGITFTNKTIGLKY